MTSMKKAGLEVGCKAWAHGRVVTVVTMPTDIDPDVIVRPNPPANTLSGNFATKPGYLERLYPDAQSARHARVAQLELAFPNNEGSVIHLNEPIERFVCVFRDGGNVILDWGDTFEEAVADAGSHILDGLHVEGVYDLDTGQKVEVTMNTPVVMRSEDQGMTVNELDPAEREEQAKFIEESYQEVAHEFSVSLTVPPHLADAVQGELDRICSYPEVERANVRRDVIRQRIIGEIVSDDSVTVTQGSEANARAWKQDMDERTAAEALGMPTLIEEGDH